MRRTWLLLVRELRALFLSPVAWGLLVLAWALTGILFRWFVLPGTAGDLHRIAAEVAGQAMQLQLFLVPLVTMRMLSEERRIGTFEMLVTTPVRDVEIVVAKWLAALVFLVLVWSVIPIYALIVLIAGGEPDFGPVLSSWLTVTTCGGLLAAIGLFASACTRQQVLAGFLSLAMIMAVFYLPLVGTYLPEGWEALRSVLNLGNLGRHVAEAGEGILDLVSLTYRLVVTAFVLLLTLRVLEVRKWA